MRATMHNGLSNQLFSVHFPYSICQRKHLLPIWALPVLGGCKRFSRWFGALFSCPNHQHKFVGLPALWSPQNILGPLIVVAAVVDFKDWVPQLGLMMISGQWHESTLPGLYWVDWNECQFFETCTVFDYFQNPKCDEYVPRNEKKYAPMRHIDFFNKTVLEVEVENYSNIDSWWFLDGNNFWQWCLLKIANCWYFLNIANYWFF